MTDRHPDDATSYELVTRFATFERTSVHDTPSDIRRQIAYDLGKAEHERPLGHRVYRLVRRELDATEMKGLRPRP